MSKLPLSIAKTESRIWPEPCCFIEPCQAPFVLSESRALYAKACAFDVKQYRDDLFQDWHIELPVGISEAAIKRKAEYFAGRYLARQLIQTMWSLATHSVRLDHDRNTEGRQKNSAWYQKVSRQQGQHQSDWQVRQGKGRCPVWPKGIVGSISHTHNRAFCAVARGDEFRYLGLDAEPIMSSQTIKEVTPLVLNLAEQRLLNSHFSDRFLSTTLAFSVKESLFKALYPYVQAYFDFDAAHIVAVNPSLRSMQLRLSKTLHPDYPVGKLLTATWSVDNDTVVSLVQEVISQ